MVGLVVFLLGLFGVPLALLAYGHRLRHRGRRAKRIFWVAVFGHLVAACIAVLWGMLPPEAWTADQTARGFAGLWSLLTLPLVGAIEAMLTSNEAMRVPDERAARPTDTEKSDR